MRISTKGRYALRLMLDLAVNDGEELIRIKDISKRQGISEKYLEQIISYLKKAGYVKSLRGAQGGYRLSMEPKEYSVGMILRLTEGNMTPVGCLEEEKGCERVDSCTTMRLWAMLNDAVKSVIDRVTLQDLVDWEREEQRKKEMGDL
ncbi:MAG: Rrf2 family transcriptional regulator [Lachnospiraceae bacterium]|nr:Rrf2 family transcriptional regulator [Lachnospiraceae bacterium]